MSTKSRIAISVSALVAIFAAGWGVKILMQKGLPLRHIDAAPVRIDLADAQNSVELRGGFSIDTGGDQGCMEKCPQPTLSVWAEKGSVRLKQSIRNCVEVGYGDPFIDGASCDGENLILKVVGSSIHVERSGPGSLEGESSRPLYILTP